jgi:anthranilate phosphoribosyltransferase
MKGETVDEITGAAEIMREKATAVLPENREFLVDTCGTGGDGSNTFNISTAVAFVAAGAGARVAKHGNRSVSSKSGSADVLEALGVNVSISSEKMKYCLDKVGISFLFAPALHKAMKYAIGPRKEMAVRTIFNLLGPLTNPAGAENQLIGVYDAALTEPLAHVLRNMGSTRAYVVHGMNRIDEVSISDGTRISELHNGSVETYTFSPDELGIPSATEDSILGGTAEDNAGILRAVLSGQKGPHRDVVLLNAAFAIAAAGLTDTPKEGLEAATKTIDSGAAMKKLENLVAASNS